jgi:hypothetical protein
VTTSFPKRQAGHKTPACFVVTNSVVHLDRSNRRILPPAIAQVRVFAFDECLSERILA